MRRLLLTSTISLAVLAVTAVAALACGTNEPECFKNGHWSPGGAQVEGFAITASPGAEVKGTWVNPPACKFWGAGEGSAVIYSQRFLVAPVFGTLAEAVSTVVVKPGKAVSASVKAPALVGKQVEGWLMTSYEYSGGYGGCRAGDPLTLVASDLVEVLP